MKYSTVTGVVRYSGGTIVIGTGDSFDEDHPLVVERPDLFGDDGPGPKFPGPARAAGGVPKVERATRAPGEKRGSSGRG